MPQSKRFGKLIAVVALGFFYAPAYAHHVPGASSAVAEISVVGCTAPSCKVILTTATTPGLKCSTDATTRNVTCNLPQGFTIPATLVSGQGQFQFTRTTSLTDTTLGAEFVATCNAASSTSPCNNLTSLSFRNTTIKKLSATTTAAQKVEVKLGFTLGLLPDATLNDSVLDATKGFAHLFSSRGTFVPASGFTALNNTHAAQYSFTYVLSNATCGTTTASTPEPFNIAGCTATRAVPCVGPATNSLNGVTCSTTGGDFLLKSSTSNAITTPGKFDLQDLTQRTCGNLFTSGNPTCRAIERQSATVSYGFVRQNDRVNITGSAVGASGQIPDVVRLSNGEALECSLHESGGGTGINPNDNGQFKVKLFGSSLIDLNTNVTLAQNTKFGLPGGEFLTAKDIRYNQLFDDPETGVPDQFFDVWAIFDASELQTVGNISCALYKGQTLTFMLQSQANVTASGTINVAGKPKGQSTGEQSFGSFSGAEPGLVSCEIPATVGPCNP